MDHMQDVKHVMETLRQQNSIVQCLPALQTRFGRGSGFDDVGLTRIPSLHMIVSDFIGEAP